MADNAVILKAELREKTGKEVALALRAEKRLPAVIYGPGLKESVNVSVNYQDFEKIFSKYQKHHVISLEVGKTTYQVLVKDYKFHPVKRSFMHVDFYNVVPGTLFNTEVPLNYIGTPIGVKEGGTLFTFKRRLKVRATQANLPDKIDVNISNVKAKQYMIVREIQKSADYKILTHEGNVLVEVK